MNKLREHFEMFRATLDHSKPFDELLWMCYYQGHMDSTPKDEEVTMEELETECFLDFVKTCIEHPEDMKELEWEDYVRVTYPCPSRNCVAFPDRCEEAGGDGDTCSRLVNLSKLCGVPEAKKWKKDHSNILTNEEVDELTKIITRLNNC